MDKRTNLGKKGKYQKYLNFRTQFFLTAEIKGRKDRKESEVFRTWGERRHDGQSMTGKWEQGQSW